MRLATRTAMTLNGLLVCRVCVLVSLWRGREGRCAHRAEGPLERTAERMRGGALRRTLRGACFGRTLEVP